MNHTKFSVCLFSLLVLGASACVSRQVPTPVISGVEIVVVRVKSDTNAFPRILDSAQVAAIVAFANERREKYGNPWFGTPIPTVEAVFYQSDSARAPLGYFGTGPSFFHRIGFGLGSGSFATRSAKSEEVREFLRLLNVPDTVVFRRRQ